ncbi:MAG: DUF6438 domain-containing protein [Bacteroidota bacterium]
MTFWLLIVAMLSTTVQKDEPYLVVSLTKTQCFGTCPAFDFELYSDCTVKYEGKAHVNQIGSFESKIKRKTYLEIVNQFEDSEFFQFQDRYYKEITDLPTTYIYYNDGGQDKKIMDYYGAPEKLKALEQSVDDLIETISWKKVSS